MIFDSETLSDADGFLPRKDPSNYQIEATITAVLERTHEKGFHLQIGTDDGYLGLYTDCYFANLYSAPLHLEYVEHGASSHLVAKAPKDEYDMLLHGKSYWTEGEGVIIWKQVKKCSVEDIIAAFQSINAGKDDWKHLFKFESGSKQYKNL